MVGLTTLSDGGPIRKRQMEDLRCRAYPLGTRILTCFPFGITITFSLRTGLLLVD